MQADLERILFDEATIHRRLDELAAMISNDYRERVDDRCDPKRKRDFDGRSSPAYSSALKARLLEYCHLSRRDKANRRSDFSSSMVARCAWTTRSCAG